MTIDIRKLNISDFGEYQNFVNKFDYSMKNHPRKVISRNTLGSKKNITVAAFKDDKIIASLTGFFPDKRPVWFGKNLFVQTSEISSGLGNYDESIFLIMDLFNTLISYAESINRYSFYTRKNLKHQLSYEKLVRRLRDRLNQDKLDQYRMLQYEIFYELKTPENFVNEDVEFQWKRFYPVNEKIEPETLVIYHTLNQNERKKMLGLI